MKKILNSFSLFFPFYSSLLLLSLFFFSFLLVAPNAFSVINRHPRGIVVTSEHYASLVGADIFRKGGNVADVAVAVAYALAVVHPSSGNLAGGGFALVHMHDRSKVIDFREVAPKHLNRELWKNADATSRLYLSTAVPGTVAGINVIHKRYAHLPLSVDMQPAINLAEKGFVLQPADLFFIKQGYKRKNFSPAARRQFTINHRYLRAGDRLIQPDLANSLKLIAKQGNSGFYQGETAEKMVRYIQQHNGVLNLNDLKSYRAKILTPLTCSYRGLRVVATPPPSQGGFILCRLLQNFSTYHSSSKRSFYSKNNVIKTVAAMQQSFAEASRYIGDPRYSPYNAQSILNKRKKRHHHIALKAGVSTEGFHTTSFVVADGNGNAISITYSLNDFFGSGKMAPGTGFFLNDEVKDFDLSLTKSGINQLKPSHAPVSSMNPVMIFRHKHLFLALGTPGGSTIPTQEALVLKGLIDYDWSLKKALKQPRYHSSNKAIYLERLAKKSLRQQFHAWFARRLTLGSHYGFDAWGGMTIVHMSAEGRLRGAVDPRRPAGAVIVIK